MNAQPRIIVLTVVVALVAMLAGCERHPQETAETSNAEFHVELLFEHDGCRVYRFWDGGNRYYTHCPGGQSRTDWDIRHSNGKTIWTEPHGILTEAR